MIQKKKEKHTTIYDVSWARFPSAVRYLPCIPPSFTVPGFYHRLLYGCLRSVAF